MSKIFENNRKQIKNFEKTRKYWKPVKEITDKKIKELKEELSLSYKQAVLFVLDYLLEIMKRSEPTVIEMINNSIKNGDFEDAKQSIKATAGYNFEALVTYVLVLNCAVGNLSELNIIVKNKNKIIKEYAIINVGDEIQKPDADIILYGDDEKSPILIISCKTSFRERAGQTYKWKLLLELANCNCTHIKNNNACPVNKFRLSYKSERKVFVSFITCDLHTEINRPQIKGMFSFFDYAYVSNNKNKINHKEIAYLSTIIKDLNSLYRKYINTKQSNLSFF